MALLMGEWTFFYDGGVGTLNLSGIDASGRFSCLADVKTVTALTNIGIDANPLESFGLWNESGQQINFSVRAGTANATILVVVFTGHLLRPAAPPPPGQDIIWRLAGYYQRGSADIIAGKPMLLPDENFRKVQFGWLAQIVGVI